MKLCGPLKLYSFLYNITHSESKDLAGNRTHVHSRSDQSVHELDHSLSLYNFRVAVSITGHTHTNLIPTNGQPVCLRKCGRTPKWTRREIALKGDWQPVRGIKHGLKIVKGEK